jgi:flagellar motor switch protein FliM
MMGEIRGAMFFTLLISTIHPVRAKLTRGATDRGALESASKTAPPSSLMGANLEMRAILGSSAMQLADIRVLKPGAIIALGETRQPVFSGTVVEDQGWRRFLIEEKRF